MLSVWAVEDRVVLRWGGGELASHWVPRLGAVVDQLARGAQEGWLGLTEAGLLTYGKATLGMFPPAPEGVRPSLRAELAGVELRRLVALTGLGYRQRDGYTDCELFVAHDPYHPLYSFPSSGVPSSRAGAMRDGLCSALALTSDALTLTTGRIVERDVDWVVVGVAPWAKWWRSNKTLRFFDISAPTSGAGIPAAFDLVRKLSVCRGVYLPRWQFDPILPPDSPPDPASRFDREPLV